MLTQLFNQRPAAFLRQSIMSCKQGSSLKKVVQVSQLKNSGREFLTIHGIILQIECRRDKNILTVWDDEVERLAINLRFRDKWNPMNKSLNRHDFEVGDVVRIEGALLDCKSKETFVDDISQVTVFDGFASLDDVTPIRHLNSSIQLTEGDRTRIQHLRRVLTDHLLSVSLESLSSESNPSFAALVVRSATNEKGHQLLAVCDGTTPQVITTNLSRESLAQSSCERIPTKETEWATLVVTIKDPTSLPFQDNVVVFFKCKITCDKNITTINCSSQKNFGKSFRIAQKNGYLDQRIRPRISAPSSTVKIVPAINDCLFPQDYSTIAQILMYHQQDKVFKLKATVCDSSFDPTQGVSSLIFTSCPECEYTDFLANCLTSTQENEYLTRVKNTSHVSIERLKCPECVTGTSLQFMWNILFIVKDVTGELVVRLTTFPAMKFLGILPARALTEESLAQKVVNLMKRVCPAKQQEGDDTLTGNEEARHFCREMNYLIKPVVMRSKSYNGCHEDTSPPVMQYLVLSMMSNDIK